MLCLPPALPLLPPSGPQTLPNLPLSCSLAPRSRSRDGSLSRFHLELQLALKDRPSLVLKRNCNINSSHESPDRSSETTRQVCRLRSACLFLFLFLGLERVSERQRSCCRREVARLGSSRLVSARLVSSREQQDRVERQQFGLTGGESQIDGRWFAPLKWAEQKRGRIGVEAGALEYNCWLARFPVRAGSFAPHSRPFALKKASESRSEQKNQSREIATES